MASNSTMDDDNLATAVALTRHHNTQYQSKLPLQLTSQLTISGSHHDHLGRPTTSAVFWADFSSVWTFQRRLFFCLNFSKKTRRSQHISLQQHRWSQHLFCNNQEAETGCGGRTSSSLVIALPSYLVGSKSEWSLHCQTCSCWGNGLPHIGQGSLPLVQPMQYVLHRLYMQQWQSSGAHACRLISI